jgi:hypothetical protein
MTITIIFRTPARTDPPTNPVIHERCFHGVPSSVAETLVGDFLAYHRDGGGDQRKSYRFKMDREEIMMAVDFDEVVAVVAE